MVSGFLRCCPYDQVRHCDYLATTDRSILLHAILSPFAHAEGLPSAEEVSDVSADEDADYDVSVVVHGQQHDKVSNRELKHVEQ